MKKKTLRKLKKRYPLVHDKVLEPSSKRFQEIVTAMEKICPVAADDAREKSWMIDVYKNSFVDVIADYEVRRYLSIKAGLADEGFVDDLFFRNYDDLTDTERKMRAEYMKHFGVATLMSSNPLLS